MRFLDHSEMGRGLAEHVAKLAPARPVVLAIPPGGVRIAWEIARRLSAPLDVLLVSEVVVPQACRCRVGCAVDGHFYPDRSSGKFQQLAEEYAEVLVAAELGGQQQRDRALRHGVPPVDLADRTAVLVSDGSPDLVALEGAVRAIRDRKAKEIIYAAPVAMSGMIDLVGTRARIVTLFRPDEYRSVMLVNSDYKQTTDDEISQLIAQSRISGLPVPQGGQGGVLVRRSLQATS
jgi:putative phosphoribosyl transferase